MMGPKFSWFTFALALPINFIWEMAQMYAYSEGGQPLTKRTVFCEISAAADATYAVLVYWAGRRWTRQACWISSKTTARVFAVLVSGFLAAVVVERLGLTAGFWDYSRSMPRIPFVGAGLWPVLQPMVVPLAVFWLVGHLAGLPHRD